MYRKPITLLKPHHLDPQPGYLQHALELLPSKLYFYTNRYTPETSPDCYVINFDDSLSYVGYNKDFGPVNLSQVHHYCRQLFDLTTTHKRVVHHCTTHYQKQANACFLACCYQILFLNKTPEEAFAPFGKSLALIPFVDAGDSHVTVKSFELAVLDCLRGFYQASVNLGWYSHRTFNCQEYENAYSLESGCDANWIIPRKICAFSSPNNGSVNAAVKLFQKWGVNQIIRLNELMYEENAFRRAGIEVIDMEFPDGSCPSIKIIE
jgi:cell division cycle 14